MSKIILEPSKRQFKQVKFNHDDHSEYIEKRRVVKFYYGVENFSRMIGRITRIYDKGVECLTDYGIYHATWDRIYRIYIPKTTGKVKESNVKACSGLSPVSIFDGVLNRIVNKCKEDYPSIKVNDKRIDLSTRFNRELKFSIGRKSVIFSIENQDSNKIDILGSALNRKSSVKLNNKGKVSVAALYKKVKILV